MISTKGAACPVGVITIGMPPSKNDECFSVGQEVKEYKSKVHSA